MAPPSAKEGQAAQVQSGSSLRAPKISVLVPTYNYARYLPETIQSVLAQDFTDFEIVIADNCSEDDSREIIKQFATRDARVGFQFNATNLGLVPNFNGCLSLARGDYVIFMASDDRFSDRTALGKMARMLDENPTAAMAVCGRFIMDANSKTIEVAGHLAGSGLHPGLEIIWLCLERNANAIGEPSAVMLRRKVLDRGFDPQYRQLLDLELWFYLLERGDLVYTREPLASIRQHPAQQTHLNSRAQNAGNEQLMILSKYLNKPWFKIENHRGAFFSQIYGLRKEDKSEASVEMANRLMKSLGRGWYAWFWLLRKVSRPFTKLRRAMLRSARRVS